MNSLGELKFSNEMRDYFLQRISVMELIHANIKNLPPDLEKNLLNNFKTIVGFVPILARRICFESEFNRVVINKYVRSDKCNTRIFSVDQLKYPPSEVAKNLSYNRASLPGVSLFYAGYGKLTTALETKPQQGDLYTTTIWKQKPDTTISAIPICFMEELINVTTQFDNDWNEFEETLKKLNVNVSIVLKQLYRFITKVFTTPVNPNDKKEYIFSASFADLFFNDADNGVDCIYYPSVPMDFSSSNIALKPEVLESKFDLIEITESICTTSPSGETNGWLSKRTGKGINVSLSSQQIQWEDENHDDINPQEIFEQFKRKLKNIYPN